MIPRPPPSACRDGDDSREDQHRAGRDYRDIFQTP